ncbi:hypothetical protein Leryth_023176 [Lithospermum erythrorhizon]|nr:hypothetical protein Leryth_023176 [Lithospermum erythrorhizon]
MIEVGTAHPNYEFWQEKPQKSINYWTSDWKVCGSADIKCHGKSLDGIIGTFIFWMKTIGINAND